MSVCRSCKAEIIWRRDNGKSVPCNPDGSDHFDECSKRQWAIVVATGKPFKRENSSGYITPDGRTHTARIWGTFTKRTDFSLPDCSCSTPPWESCIHETP